MSGAWLRSSLASVPFTPSNPGKISGSFSASLTGFQPTPAYAQLSVGATSSRTALPSGSVVIVYNTGSNPAFVTLGTSTVTATTANDVVPAGGWIAFTVGPNTFIAAIETGGATSLNISGGSGLPTVAGGNGGGGGGGSNPSVGTTSSAALPRRPSTVWSSLGAPWSAHPAPRGEVLQRA